MNRQKIFTILLIAVGALALIFFGMRAMRSFNKMRGGGHFGHKPPVAQETDVEFIRDWMPIPYIAHTYAVPEPYLYDKLGVPSDKKNRKKSLSELNMEFFPDQEGIVLEKIKAAVKEFQASPPPPPDAPDAPQPDKAPPTHE